MKKSVWENEFIDAFKEMGRDNNFSYEGKKALYNYLEDYEEQTGEEIELDIIALCCEYTEYENLEEFNDNYGKDCKSLEDIEYYTQVIPVTNERFIIQDF